MSETQMLLLRCLLTLAVGFVVGWCLRKLLHR